MSEEIRKILENMKKKIFTYHHIYHTFGTLDALEKTEMGFKCKFLEAQHIILKTWQENLRSLPRYRDHPFWAWSSVWLLKEGGQSV